METKTILTRDKRTLEDIMSEVACNAQKRGLTPEILAALLNEP